MAIKCKRCGLGFKAGTVEARVRMHRECAEKSLSNQTASLATWKARQTGDYPPSWKSAATRSIPGTERRIAELTAILGEFDK